MVVFSLTLVRHGETAANKSLVIQGHQDVALSEVGLEQARLVALRLQGDSFSHIYSSDLSRAAQTAQAIAEANPCTCPIRLDKRLRERKFGQFEGRTFKELYEEAQKHNLKWTDYVPEGGETYAEVRARAVSFFHDLCLEMMMVGSSQVENPNSFHQNTSFVRGQPAAVGTAVIEGQDRYTAQPQGCVGEGILSKRARLEEAGLHRLSLDGDDAERDCVFTEESQPVRSMPRSNSSSSSGCSSLHDSLEADTTMEADHSPTAVFRDGTHRTEQGMLPAGQYMCLAAPGLNSPLNGLKKVCVPNTSNFISDKDGTNCSARNCSNQTKQQACSVQFGGPVRWHCDMDTARSQPRAVVDRTKEDYSQACPNVSLSPVFDHRVTSTSSVSSGRNSSFDDADVIPPVVADLLVVSHGGLIKMLLSHFIEDLHCKVPGGKEHALRVCPNTGVSRFMVTVCGCAGSEELQPAVTCLMMNDKDHLKMMAPLPDPLPVSGGNAPETPAV